jgi:DNA polymerase elongation subunit (family B)
MQNFIYKDFKVIPSDKKKVPENQEEYSGAFVWPSRPQIARMVGGLDFASLYPSIIREFNMSPETYKGRANDKDDRSDKDLIYTASGVLYERNRSGIIPNILTYYFAQRKQAKNDMKQADTEHQYYSDILEKRLSAAKIDNN